MRKMVKKLRWVGGTMLALAVVCGRAGAERTGRLLGLARAGG